MSDVYYPLEVVPNSPATFSGSIISSQLSQIGITRFSANAQRATRHKSATQACGSDDFAIVFPTHCRVHFEQGGLEGDVSPGEVVILKSAEPYTMVVPDQTQNITLKFPSEYLRELYPAIDSVCARRSIANSKFVSVVAQVALQGLETSMSDSPGRILHMERGLHELIYLMLDAPNGVGESTAQSLSDLVFQDLMRFVAHNFHNPSMTPELGAKELRISVRYVHKIFKAHDTTFCNELLKVRLQHAQKLLCEKREGRSNMRTIAEISYACGFSSQSHFTMRYKDAFGHTPREARLA